MQGGGVRLAGPQPQRARGRARRGHRRLQQIAARRRLPVQHLPGGECTGFIVEYDGFGVSSDGRPNAIYFSGDTVYVEELTRTIPPKWNITVAILNLGKAQVQTPDGGALQITMDGKQGARLFRELGADFLVPMHFESWGHFTQFGDELRRDFEEEGVGQQVRWLTPGQPKKLL